MKRLFVAAFSLALLLMCGCEPTIDASSEDSLRASVQELKQTLPEEEREEFDKAVMTVAMADADFGAIMAGLQDEKTLLKSAKERLDGKTAEEILAEAETIRAKREAERRAEQLDQAKNEIAELEAEKAGAEKAKSQLSKFEVKRSKFYKQEQRFGGPEPVIELEVVNNTDTAVSRAYFKGTYATPGRSIPWLEETFNYQISGGLEPGESADWSLSPNMFSEWGQIDERDDAVFTVEVVRLDGPNGEPAYEASFDDDDARRLESLKQKLAELTN